MANGQKDVDREKDDHEKIQTSGLREVGDPDVGPHPGDKKGRYKIQHRNDQGENESDHERNSALFAGDFQGEIVKENRNQHGSNMAEL